jgi:hypothetical protein
MAGRSPLPFAIAFGVIGFALLAYVSATHRPTRSSIAAAPEQDTPPVAPLPTPTPRPAEADSVISKNRGLFKQCFDKCLKEDPKCAGKVTTTITIGASGAPTDVSSTSTDAPASMVECIRQKFLGLSFPPPDGGSTQMVVPLVLQPAK